jgi:hypothetical protein
MARLAEVIQIIQQQQALEERKEERHHDLALQLLSQDVAQESRLKEVELQGTISEYYDLKKEREQVATTLRKEYPRLQKQFVSDNFAPIANTFEGVAEGDMSNLQNSMDQLITDITNLKEVDRQLLEQKSYYKGQEQAIAGLTTLVDPGEFETFVEEYEEKFPGRPTAGLYAAYDAGAVTTYQRRQAATDMQAISKASAQSNWEGMRTMVTSDEFEVSDYTENELLQAEISKMISHDNYQDVINYMNAEPTGKVKDVFYKMFPSLMGAMEGHVQSVDDIESEFLGRTKEAHVENITNDFLSSIATVKSNKEAFILYDEQQALLTNEEDKNAMFDAMEKQLGKGDLYEGKGGYKEHLDKKSKFKPEQPLRASLKEPVLESYTATDDETTAEQVYEALDTIEAIGRVSEEGLAGRDVHAGFGELILGPAGELTTEREEWTPGKAMFGGLGSLDIGFDSPYYDAFYNEVGDQFSNLMSEEDPFGPDFLYSGMAEEHQIPRLIRERYGDAVYESVYRIADEAGRNAQIKEIENVLKKRSGEDYWDLIRALDAIKE